jgi:hypothetical protein
MSLHETQLHAAHLTTWREQETLKKMIVAAMLVMGTTAFAHAQQQQQADPLVSALNQLVENLSGTDAAVNPAEGNAASTKAGKSKKESAVIIGTAAAIGSAVGAMIAKEDRAKGAAIGAAVGGIAGLIYDRMHAKEEKTTGAEAPAPANTELNKKIL